MVNRSFGVAVVQAAPVFLNLDATVDRALERIGAAARAGASLVAFGETWLTGYPAWIDSAPGAALWDSAPARAVYRRLFEQSPTIDGPELARLHEAARAHDCDVVMGLHERRGNTLYNTIASLSRDGRSRALRRKLVPTYTERMIWGRGDGSTLEVLGTPHGNVGAMVCWEHWMPALRQVMHAAGEIVHVAQWPSGHDLHQLASRQYAFEGGCFVLCCGTPLSRGGMIEGYRSLGADEGLELLEALPGDDDTLLLDGRSSIVAPDTSYVVEPVIGREEIVFAEIDPARCDESRLKLDVAGHYSRPDLFTLSVDRRPQENVRDDS